VKDYANDLIKRAEDEADLEMTLDEAVNQLVAFEKKNCLGGCHWKNASKAREGTRT